MNRDLQALLGDIWIPLRVYELLMTDKRRVLLMVSLAMWQIRKPLKCPRWAVQTLLLLPENGELRTCSADRLETAPVLPTCGEADGSAVFKYLPVLLVFQSSVDHSLQQLSCCVPANPRSHFIADKTFDLMSKRGYFLHWNSSFVISRSNSFTNLA